MNNIIEDLKISPLKETNYIKPLKVNFTLNGIKKSWEAVRSHDSVAVLLYHQEKRAFLFVKQFRIPVYLNDNNIFVLGDIIEVEYSALNESISDLYSVDYEEGILYLAAEPNKDLEVVYDSYNILVDAKKAIQLEDEEYTVTDLTGNSTNGVSSTINNFKNNIEYEAIYSIEKESKDLYRTPIITNVKLNYINVSEQESLWVVLIEHF